MAEQKPEEPNVEEKFSPRGTMVLMVLYALTFAIAWASVYFGELLPRK